MFRFGLAILSTALVSLLASPTTADTASLQDYLLSMDRVNVTFSGRIKYSSGDDSFTFYDDRREPFSTTIDAGRDAREKIETLCDNPSFLVSYTDLCKISGSGSVEIRGSRIFLSIEAISELSE